METTTHGIRWLDALHSPGVREAYSLGLHEYPDMSADQTAKFAYAFDRHINAIQVAHALHASGSLDDEIFDAHLAGLAAQITTPGGSTYWQDIGSYYPPTFAAEVDRRVAEGNLHDALANPHFQLD